MRFVPHLTLYLLKKWGGPALPLSSNYIHEHSYENDNLTLQDHLLQCLDGSCNLMLIRSFWESEEKYADELSVLAMNKIMGVDRYF
jgi:hypothetical protein